MRPLQNIDELDSIRGIGILLVFFFHACGFLKVNLDFMPNILSSFIKEGHSGVTLLFVLSAFLISKPYLKSMNSGILPSTRNFYLKRILKIIPLYMVMVVIASLVYGDLAKFLRALCIFWGVNGPEMHPFSNVWWALYTEIQFYLVMPFVGYLLLTKKKRLLLLMLVSVYITCYLCMQLGLILRSDISSHLRLLYSLFGKGYIFIIGILLSWFVLKYENKLKSIGNNVLLQNGAADFFFFLIILAIGLLLKWVSKVNYWNAEIMIFNWHFLEALLWSLFIITILFLPIRIKPLFSNVVLKKIGMISYSIFLIHVPVIWYGIILFSNIASCFHQSNLHPIILLISLFIITIILSSITYRFIERPFLKLKTKYK